MPNNRLVVFGTRVSETLAKDVCNKLSIGLGKVALRVFEDGEIFPQIEEDVRDADVFIIGSTQPPTENIWELMLLADAAKNSSAGRVTLVIPYLGYNRQDKKDRPRVPRSALVAINALKHNADRVLLFDLHSEVTMGFFDPVIADHLYGSIVTAEYLSAVLEDKHFVVASPDKGGGPRAEKFAHILGMDDYVLFTKSREGPNKVKGDKVKIIGEVEETVVFVDDMADTGGTLEADAKAARKAGAKTIIACVTHALLSGRAVTRLDGNIDELVMTDTIEQHPEKLKAAKTMKITVLSIAELIGQAIRRTHDGESVSALIL